MPAILLPHMPLYNSYDLVYIIMGFLLYISVQFPKSVRPLREALMEHYSERCRWWSAVDLARRFLFLLLVVVLPGNQVSTSTIAIIIYIGPGVAKCEQSHLGIQN